MIVAGRIGQHPLYPKKVRSPTIAFPKGWITERAHNKDGSDASRKPHAAPIGCKRGYERGTKCDALVRSK